MPFAIDQEMADKALHNMPQAERLKFLDVHAWITKLAPELDPSRDHNDKIQTDADFLKIL